MIGQFLFSATPEPEDQAETRVRKYAKTATGLVVAGAKKTAPVAKRSGAWILGLIKRVGSALASGIKKMVGAVKNKIGNRDETVSTDGEPKEDA